MVMTELIPGIRNCVRAVILKDENLLLLRKSYEDGSERFGLPGGAQDAGEVLTDALQRECLEEIGSKVAVQGLLYLADYFKPRSTDPMTYRHQVEFFFLCQIPENYKAHNGDHPDKHQVSVDWVAIDRLASINLTPADLTSLLLRENLLAHPIYLGKFEP